MVLRKTTTGPGEQSQLDWDHFGNWNGSRLYGLALTLSYSRMRYIEFTHKQDAETLMSFLVRAFHYFGGMTEVILADDMKTVVEDRIDGQAKWNTCFLDFASYYGSNLTPTRWSTDRTDEPVVGWTLTMLRPER